MNNIYSKNLIQGCNQLVRNYFIYKLERVKEELSERNDTHILGHYFFIKYIKSAAEG